ncbi:MAG: AAA family ATPase [Anaerolineales bacterium]
MLEIRVLGQCQIRLDGKPVEIPSRPSQSLLAYLALHSGIAQRREKLAGMFWPEASDVRARNNLRYNLWQIRRALEAQGAEAADHVLADKISVTLVAGEGIWVDAAEFSQPLPEDRNVDQLVQAASVYAGELLPGFYDEWVLLERDRLSAAYDQHMAVLLERLAEEDRWAAVFEWSERWISLGHGPEAAYRGLMRAHFALGDASGLSASYSRCREALLQHLGVEPSAQTVRLFRDLSQSLAPPSVVTRPERSSLLTREAETASPWPRFLEEDSGEEETHKFAGRGLELRKLESMLTRALDGRGQVVSIMGEAGRGKTALVEEFTRRAEARWPNLLVVSGNCDLYTGAGDPYLPFREVLSNLSGDVEARWAAGSISQSRALRLWKASEGLAEVLAKEGPDLVGPFVPGHVVRGKKGGSERAASPHGVSEARTATNGSDGPASPHRNRLFEEYTNVLRVLAERNPLLIVLEDVHWLDPSSADLLSHVLPGLVDRRALVVLTYRPEEIVSNPAGEEHPLAKVLVDLKQARGEFWIDLDQSEERAGRELVDAIVDLQPNTLEGEFRANLARVTGGHPLFVLELLQDLRERGDLTADASGSWTLAGRIDWKVTPARVEGVIEKRVGRLDRELREALIMASVQGEQFTAEAIARVQGVDERALVRRLTHELEGQHRLVREVAAERVGHRQLSQFRFRHILTQRYLYQRLGASERGYLHEAMGKALEDLYGGEVGLVAHRLARHFAEAGLDDKAALYLRRAGEQALQISAYQEAVGHLSRARDLMQAAGKMKENAPRAALAELERLLGESYYGLGDLPRSQEHLGRAAALLGWPLPRDRGGLGFAIAPELAWQLARRLWPLRRKVRPELESPSWRTAARVYKLLAEIYVVGQDHPRTLYATLRSLNLAERGGPSPELARSYADMSALCPLLGLPGLAETFRRLAKSTAEHVGQESVTAYVLLATSVFTVGEARWEESRASLDRAIELYRRLGDWNRLGTTLMFRSHVDLFLGEFPAFSQRLRELEQLAKRSGSFLHRIWALDGQAEASLRTGNAQAVADVIPALQFSLTQIQGKGLQSEEAVVYGLLTQAFLRLNRFAEAREAADAAAERITKSPPTFYSELEGYAGPVQGYLEFWEKAGEGFDRGSQEAQVNSARRLLLRFARIFPVARPRMEILEAWRTWLAGDKAGAGRKWLRAAALARSLTMPLEEAQAHQELGRHLDPGDPKRLEHLRLAQGIFARMGAVFEVARLDEILLAMPTSGS